MANTYSYQQVWEHIYQHTFYKQPVFRVFADEKWAGKEVEVGDTFNRRYGTDFYVNDMTAAGGYTNQAFTQTPESLTVNTKKEVSFQLVDWQKMLDDLPTQAYFGNKAMNNLWLGVDADIIGTAQAGAGSAIDDATINGTSGTSLNGVAVSVGNIASVFAAATQQFHLQNVILDPNKKFTSEVKLETMEGMPSAIISPQVYNTLVQYVGGKTTILGDTVSRSGHVGAFFGFNLFVSNNLPVEMWFYQATNITAGDTITFLNGVTVGGVSQALTFTAATTATNAGDFKVASSAALTLTNLKNALNAPYTTISDSTNTGYVALTKSSLTTTQVKFLAGITATQVLVTGAASASGTYLKLVITGQTSSPVTATMTTATNLFVSGLQIQHNLFTVGKSVTVVMPVKPKMYVNYVSGAVAKDFVTWELYGKKVFTDQSFQIVDLKVAASSFSTMPLNVFN